MTYIPVDGDISDFINSMIDLADEFRTDELRSFLFNEGHSFVETVGAIVGWQRERFHALDPIGSGLS